MDAFERLRGVLARANAVGVGCHYWSLPEYGVPTEQVVELGLARPINTRIPTCEDHGCHLLATCRHRATFADAQPGRAGRKFRLAPEGVRAAESTAGLADRLCEAPLARRVLEAVSVAGALSPLALYWWLLEPELEELAETGERPAARLSRPALRLYLDLLIAAGWLREDPAEGTVRSA